MVLPGIDRVVEGVVVAGRPAGLWVGWTFVVVLRCCEFWMFYVQAAGRT